MTQFFTTSSIFFSPILQTSHWVSLSSWGHTDSPMSQPVSSPSLCPPLIPSQWRTKGHHPCQASSENVDKTLSVVGQERDQRWEKRVPPPPSPSSSSSFLFLLLLLPPLILKFSLANDLQAVWCCADRSRPSAGIQSGLKELVEVLRPRYTLGGVCFGVRGCLGVWGEGGIPIHQ